VTGETLYVSFYGPGAGLAAAPVLALAALAGRDLDDPWWLWYAAKLAASLFSAASVALVFLTCREFLALRPSLALAVAYGLGTSLWSMSSQTLWQHGPNTFFLALGTWLLVRNRSLAPSGLAACGAAFAAATACRPTSVFYVFAVAVWLLLANRRAALAFVAGAAPIAVLLAAYNWYYLGTPLRSGQATYARFLLTGGSVAEGLAGLLVSPSRGLFVFSPFLLLAVPGAVAAWRDRTYTALRPLSAAALAVIALHAAWPNWWGGWSYGSRIIADLAATLTVLLVPVIPWVLAHRARTVAFGAACAWAVGLQAVGAFAYDSDWNTPKVFAIQVPSGPQYFVTREEAVEAARRAGQDRVYQGSVSLDTFHGTLWSAAESQPVAYLSHLDASRQRQLEQTSWWIGLWRR
jgi:hypothetical protein